MPVCELMVSFFVLGSSVNVKLWAIRIYSSKDSKTLRILQVTWHPHSDTHLGFYLQIVF